MILSNNLNKSSDQFKKQGFWNTQSLKSAVYQQKRAAFDKLVGYTEGENDNKPKAMDDILNELDDAEIQENDKIAKEIKMEKQVEFRNYIKYLQLWKDYDFYTAVFASVGIFLQITNFEYNIMNKNLYNDLS